MERVQSTVLLTIVSILLVVALSGCTLPGGGQGTITYSNDIVTVTDYKISSTTLYPGEQTIVSFLVKNNGEWALNNVLVNFYNLGGLKIVDIHCDEGTPSTSPTDSASCTFNDILSFDNRRVELTLQAPQQIAAKTVFRIEYSMSYPYNGTRIANIPIIDDTTIKKPYSAFSQSSVSYGPVSLEFNPPVGRVVRTDKTETTEYWGVNNNPYKVGLTLKHVGTVPDVKPVNITSISLTLTSAQWFRDFYCDFCKEEDTGKCTPTYLVYTMPQTLKLDKTISLSCYFKSSGDQPEFPAFIQADYNYYYEYLRTETFTVQKPSDMT